MKMLCFRSKLKFERTRAIEFHLECEKGVDRARGGSGSDYLIFCTVRQRAAIQPAGRQAKRKVSICIGIVGSLSLHSTRDISNLLWHAKNG